MKTSASRLPPPVWGWVGGGVRWAPWDSSPSPPPKKKGKKKVISHPKLMQLKGREPGKNRERQTEKQRESKRETERWGGDRGRYAEKARVHIRIHEACLREKGVKRETDSTATETKTEKEKAKQQARAKTVKTSKPKTEQDARYVRRRSSSSQDSQIVTAYRHHVPQDSFSDDDRPESAASLKTTESWKSAKVSQKLK